MGAAQPGFLDTAYRPSPRLWPHRAEASARGPRATCGFPRPAQHRAPPTGVIMVFSTSAFGAYFKLTEGAPSNSSLVDFLAPVSAEPAGASVGLAWLAVGSMCLFIAGERGPRGGQGGGRANGDTLSLLGSHGPQRVQASRPHLSIYVPISAFIAGTTCHAPS